ncbi:DUF6907 domain-containing protein [Nocardioides sp. P5_C9_2]
MSAVFTEHDPADAALPAIECAPWCIDGSGHADANFPEDQVCTGETVELSLSRVPLVEVGTDEWARQQMNFYLLRHPGALQTTIEMYRGDLGETVSLTVDEAQALGQALVEAARQAAG